jgi:hypothetical protein
MVLNSPGVLLGGLQRSTSQPCWNPWTSDAEWGQVYIAVALFAYALNWRSQHRQ